MEIKEILRKIGKMMAIASDPSASDQEIQLAAYKAKKLMIQYKISEYDLNGYQEKQDVLRIELNDIGSGYFVWVLNVIAESSRCKAVYSGKINSVKCRFALWGLNKDVDLCLPIANGLKESLRTAYLDMHIAPKYEVVVAGVPAVVIEKYEKIVKIIKIKFEDTSFLGYTL